MKTRYIIPLFFASSVALVSCKKELMPQDSSSTPADSTAVAAAPQTPVPNQAPVAQIQPNPQTNVNPAVPAPVAKGMNPPHGQPGHRCDIAVGAPLNSPPAKPGVAAQKIIPNQPLTVNPTAQKTPVATAPGMNPPHGQEGHRCDIAVGAPLSTPKATPATTPATLTPTPETVPTAKQ